ncbi:MAG: tungsten formylmethanofuran dehydrogenase [Ectothiorhodospiraceae bacterium]|nr:tungsten formylmethanofuran dehydrogenase [Ectothiorhodospiraceae bacterium]
MSAPETAVDKEITTPSLVPPIAIPSDSRFTHQDLVEFFRTMLLARRLDQKMLTLLKQGKSFFHIGGSGHEAGQLAAAKALVPGKDWSYPYYRDLTYMLGMGMSAEQIMTNFLARAADVNSGGRQMPQHYGFKDARVVSQSSPTGTQFLQAVGTAKGAVLEGLDEVVYVSAGEGTTSQGDFHEALNWASRVKLPVVFNIQDNKYAISVPRSVQTGGTVYDMVSGYVNLERHEVDGTNFFETHAAFEHAVDRARRGQGPTVIVTDVVRLLPHSSSDDHRKYRSPEELEHDQARDPILRMQNTLVKAGIFDEARADEIREEVRKTVEEATATAEALPQPAPSTATTFVFDENPIALEYEKSEPSGNKVVLVDAINHALHEEMERNEKIVVYGQDVEDGKGGVFTATRGLSTKFGKDRCFNSPLAESSIVGTSVGLAVKGFKPVVEIQFGDYIWTAMMQIRNEVATMRYRSNNHWSSAVVIRVPVGGYIHGALYHSQNIEAYFAHVPGLKVAYPSNAADAKGLLKTACRISDPVLFLEHKGIYRQSYATALEPDADYLLPFGKAAIRREGSDLTIVTWGAIVSKAMETARILAKEGIEIEVIDIRTIVPLDIQTIIESVKKTNKVLVAHEDNLTGGFGAEIAAQIASEAFEHLDGPVQRVGAKDAHIPYSWALEPEVLPQESDVQAAARALLEY